jgi:hypothetical protein
MNARMPALMAVALLLMATAASLLTHVGRHQTLSPPGVRTHPLTSSIRLEADLPEHVLDYQSKEEETEDVVLATLPKDTSFGHRLYVAPDGFRVDLRVVLMGRDRTSMHKPQLCLTGQGWRIDGAASQETSFQVVRPYQYELPVVKLVAKKSISEEGRSQTYAGVYVYWYVAHDAISASATGLQRMWLMATRLLRTGVLQRWAYVSSFAACAPGQEAATYERMKQFLAAAVPDFQLYPAKPMANSLTAAK